MKGWLLFVAGFVLALILVAGTTLFLITLSSHIIPSTPPPTRSYVPSLERGTPLEGKSEGHLYNIEVSPRGLRAAVDVSIAEALVSSLLSQQLAKQEAEGGLPARIENLHLDLQENDLFLSALLTAKDFQSQGSQKIDGDVSLLVQGVEVLPNGYQAQVELSCGEDVVNSLIAWQLPRIQEEQELPLKVNSLRVAFREEQVMAVVGVDIGGLKIDVGARARVGVEDGKPQITIEELDLGLLPIPSPIRGKINELVNYGIGSIDTGNLPFELQDISVREGRLHLLALIRLAE